MLALTILIASATFSLQTLLHVVSLSNATISPDGTRIAFVVSRVDAVRNGYDDALDLYDRRSQTMHRLVAQYTSVGNLAWTSDGSRLAAVVDDAQGVSQIFLIDPASGSARQLTRGGSSVLQISWDPAGDGIAFTRRDHSLPKKGVEAYEDAFRVDDNAYLDEHEARPYHIWFVDRQRRERKLTHGTLSAIDSPLSWSPDGRFILYEEAQAVHGLHDRAYAARVDIKTLKSTYATLHESYEDQALYSPDGARIAYLRVRGGDPVNQDDAWVQRSDKSNDRDVSFTLDRQVSILAWMPSAAALLLQIDDRTKAPIVLEHIDGTMSALPMGPVVAASIQSQGSVARDGTIAFIGDQQDRSDEIYVLAPHATAPRRLTSFNDATAALKLGKTTRVAWRSSDGFEEDGVLTYPPGYIAGHRYPLVLRIHGGAEHQAGCGRRS